MSKISTLTLGVALLLASVAQAQAATGDQRTARMEQALQQRFEQADANYDGRLALVEAQTGMPRVAQHFAELDSAHRGYLTLDQLEAMLRLRLASK